MTLFFSLALDKGHFLGVYRRNPYWSLLLDDFKRTILGVDNTVRYTDNCSNLCVISYGEEEVTRLQKTSNDEDEKNMQDSFCSSLFFNCSFFLL